MPLLNALIANKAWIAHLLGLATITAAEISKGETNPVLLATVTILTSVFHVCDTFKKVKTTQVLVDTSPRGAYSVPAVDDALTSGPLSNAAGDQRVEP